MGQTFKVAINPGIINKIEKGNRKLFGVLTNECQNVELTLAEFAAGINQGYAFCAQHHDRRRDENFICSDIVAVDIDGGMTLTEALANQFVQQFASIIYTTPSHTLAHQRFRIVFALERTITDATEMRMVYQGLIRKFGGDEACKDACRAFFGSKGSQPVVLGNILSNIQLDHLIALGSDRASVPDRTSTDGSKSYPVVARRSSVDLRPEHPVTCSSGLTMPFREVPFGANVHCPVHLDNNPSAFVVKSKDGDRGVYCHSCHATFWIASGKNEARRTKTTKAFDFFRTDDIIRELEYQQDPGSYYDEKDAPEGLVDAVNADRSCHTFSKQYWNPTDIKLMDGVILLCGDKGTGKTEVNVSIVAEARRQGKTVLLIGHRQILLKKNAERLGLTNYTYVDGSKVKNNKPTDYYAICLDSMGKLLKPQYDKYDIVILDESEQIFSHLIGSTLREQRRACYMQFFHYLAAAKTVIVADADIGAITVEGLVQAIGQKHTDFHFYLNEYRDRQRELHHYDSETHLIQDMLNTIRAGGRHYIATNSINKASQLQEAIRQQLGDGIKVMLVTAKTAGQPAVQAFVDDIKNQILAVDVTIASPTLGTGIDITFEGNEQHIDTVFGIFVARVNNHFDIDQQLARVRHPKAIKVWVSPETYSFETEPEVILREAELSGALNDILIGYKSDGLPKLDDTYLSVYAQIVSISRASKNNLRENFLALRKRNGWKVVSVAANSEHAELGKEVKTEAKKAVDAAAIAEICEAEQITADSYDLLLNNNSPLSKEEDAAMRRFEVETFYRENVTPELLSLDNKGVYRRQLEMLEIYLSPTEKLVGKDLRDSELATIVTDAKKRTLKQSMLKELLKHARLADDSTPIKIDVAITSDGLDKFVAACEENAGRLQDVFGITLRADLHERPMMQLGVILNRLGLSLDKFAGKNVGKQTIRSYRVHPGAWDIALRYLERRRHQKDDLVLQLKDRIISLGANGKLKLVKT